MVFLSTLFNKYLSRNKLNGCPLPHFDTYLMHHINIAFESYPGITAESAKYRHMYISKEIKTIEGDYRHILPIPTTRKIENSSAWKSLDKANASGEIHFVELSVAKIFKDFLA